MCYTIQFVVDCTECSYRQRLGAPIRQICVVAAQGKPCRMHQNYESRDQHVCGSCLQEQKEREEKARKEAERKIIEEEAAAVAAAKKKNDEIQVQNIMRQLARLRQ
ncbi:hypothetical protein CEP51_007274 [Fusarium floridanum]|uniref:Uncharacterized protein n=2 Tax=Fusarium solani species complex TaxID=232080 RepID=A0A428RPZ2_9HYPO|nr:hypothetical protein CEP51_007274 [Fusarium floridanum]RSM05277.1 hypothetical protein CDV31_009675 [Fusarium ambrosium]